MYRLLVWCAILALAEPYRRPCGNRCPEKTRRNNLEIMLEPIERDLIEQEERFVQFCNANSPAIIGELYGTDNYFVTYDLPEARDSRITVRIKHKFLLTTATRRDNQEVIFQDVKLLPDIANTEAAEWTYENGQTLKITMPYKVALGEAAAKTCGDVNKQIIDVPCAQSPGSIYESQDSSVNGHYDPDRRSGSNYGSQDSTENGHSAPARGPHGSSYVSQDSSENGYGAPSRRPHGSSYGSQDSSENGYGALARRPDGSSYVSQDSSENGYGAPARRSHGSSYGSQDSSENGYGAPGRRPHGSSYGSQDSSENGYGAPGRRPHGYSYGAQYSVPARRSAGFSYGSQDSTENKYDDQTNGFVFR